MKRQTFYSTLFAGALGISTLCLFYTGANALDLGEFTGADQKVITQDAPKAGGAVLVKENVVYSKPKLSKAYLTQPTGGLQTVSQTSAQGLPVPVPPEGKRVAAPGFIDRNTTTDASDPYAKVQTRMNNPGVASAPVDGNPWYTDTLANGARVEDLNEITPAAGGRAMIGVQAQNGRSVQAQTATGSSINSYNR